MNVLYLLVPLALVLAGGAAAAFRWAVRDGQFDDVETPALRILLDDEDLPTLPTRAPMPTDAPLLPAAPADDSGLPASLPAAPARRINTLNLKPRATPGAGAAAPARRTAQLTPPAPEGAFIDGRAGYDWARVPGFGPPAAEQSALDADGPRPLGPLADEVADAALLALAWQGTAGATAYEVEVSPDAAFARDVLAVAAGPATEIALVGAIPAVGARLFWRVRAVLPGGVSRWSARARFYAGRPQDVEAGQARAATQADAARRQAAQTALDDAARLALVPNHLREGVVGTDAVAVRTVVALFVLMLLTLALVGVSSIALA